MKMAKGKSPGKKCASDIYEMKAVTPETIAYAACMVIYIFSNAFTSADLSLTRKTYGVHKMEPSMHPSSFRILWICLMTKNGARKHYLSGPSK